MHSIDKFNDVSTQTDEFISFFQETTTQTEEQFVAVPVFRQDCFLGSLPKKLKLEKDVLKEVCYINFCLF